MRRMLTLKVIQCNQLEDSIQKRIHYASMHLAVSARVMLIINIDAEEGLVNGAVGTIISISTTKNDFHQPNKSDNANIGKKSMITI